MGIDAKTYALSKKYTDNSLAGGGAIKGKNATIDSITDITGGHRVTFKWTLDNGTVQTATMDVMNGAKGDTGATGAQGVQGETGNGITRVTQTGGSHIAGQYDTYTITYTDGTTSTFQIYNGANGEGSLPKFTTSLLSSGWTDQSGYYTQTVNVTGMTAEITPAISLVTAAGAKDDDLWEAFGHLYRVESAAGALTFWADEEPTEDISLMGFMIKEAT